MSNQNAPHRVPLSELGQRRIQAVKSKGIYVLPNAFTADDFTVTHNGTQWVRVNE